MTWMKLHLHGKNIFLILLSIFVSGTFYLAPLSAQEAEFGSEFRKSGRLHLAVPKPSEGEQPTGTNSTKGGERPLDISKCSSANEPITALVPVIRGRVGGSTLVGYPTFWFYLPYAAGEIDKISFVVQDDEDRDLHPPVEPKLPGQPGVIGIQLPSASPPLEVGKEYRWYFTVYCDPDDAADFDSVEGVIQRLEGSPALSSQLESATDLDRIALYTENGSWYDALTLLVEMLRADPRDFQLIQDWKDLMKLASETGDLSNIEPKITDCCNFGENSNQNSSEQ